LVVEFDDHSLIYQWKLLKFSLGTLDRRDTGQICFDASMGIAGAGDVKYYGDEFYYRDYDSGGELESFSPVDSRLY
jgi:hypothetical protein